MIMIIILMPRIIKNLQQLFISPRPTAILRRTRSLARKAPRIPHPRLRLHHLLHLNLMLPAVAKIILILENIVFIHELLQAKLLLILHARVVNIFVQGSQPHLLAQASSS